MGQAEGEKLTATAAMLGYASRPRFLRRRRARARGLTWLGASGIVWAVLIGIHALVMDWDDGFGVAWYPFAGCVSLIMGITGIWLLVRGGAWETRIEGNCLHITRPHRPTIVVPIADLLQWVNLDAADRAGETDRIWELRLRGGQTVRLSGTDAIGFRWRQQLLAELRRMNPSLQVVHEVAPPSRRQAA